jgi:hypothetical protein
MAVGDDLDHTAAGGTGDRLLAQLLLDLRHPRLHLLQLLEHLELLSH